LAGWLSGFRAQTGYVACDVIRCLGEAAAPGGGGLWAVPRLCIEYPGICLTTEENHGNLSQGSTNVVYIYMEFLVKPEMLTSYIYGPTFGNAESRLFLFAAQCFNSVLMQSDFC